jgi:hypothetical protein
MNTETEIQMNVAYNILEEAWTPENKGECLDEAVFANYVINKWDENTLAEWIMRLISNVLGEYDFEGAETVEEFEAKAEAALKDRRAN